MYRYMLETADKCSRFPACKVLQISDRFYPNPNLTACFAVGDFVCQTNKFIEMLSVQGLGHDDTPHRCKKPCQTVEYKSVVKANPDYRQDALKLFVDIGTNEVVILEEYLVYDFNDIVSSVGGSLGLFLGFSCLEVCRVASRMMSQKRATKKSARNKKKSVRNVNC